jgi:hypothetical protein
VLDRVSQQAVLGELRALASEGLIGPGSGLACSLDALAMDPADFYGVRGAGFTSLRRELGWLPGDPHPQEESLTRAIGAGLLHLDDPDRLRATAQLFGTGKRWRCLPEALALLWQASACRDELRQLLHLLA